MRHSGIPFTKSLKKVSAALLTGVILLSSIGEVAAYTVTTTGNTNFNSEKANFEKAKSPMYCNKSESISGKISSARKQDIYHYECQEGGYYAFYTTGSSDTVGAVYEEENGIFSTDYELRDWNDDAYSGVRNFNVVVDLDKNEDYYVCVRCYGTKTGSYTLKIQPNEDLFSLKNYGVWKCKNMPTTAAIIKVWTDKKVYLNKEQVLLYYWSLNPNRNIVGEKNSYTVSQLKQEFKAHPTTAYNFIVSAISTAIGVASPSLSIPSAIAAFVVSEGIGFVSSSSMTRSKMEDLLSEKCGVQETVNASNATSKYTVKKGLLATRYFANTSYNWEYTSYTPGSTQLKGVKWYFGEWSWDNYG